MQKKSWNFWGELPFWSLEKIWKTWKRKVTSWSPITPNFYFRILFYYKIGYVCKKKTRHSNFWKYWVIVTLGLKINSSNNPTHQTNPKVRKDLINLKLNLNNIKLTSLMYLNFTSITPPCILICIASAYKASELHLSCI